MCSGSKKEMKKAVLIVLLAYVMSGGAFAQTAPDFVYALNSAGNGLTITKYNGRATQVRIPAVIEGVPVKEIGIDSFANNRTITSVIIPEGVVLLEGWERLFDYVTNIPTRSGAFTGCSSLSSVTLPNSLVEIGDAVFSGCTSLSSITLPGKLEKIGFHAFKDCTRLASINLPESLSEIGGGAFWGCTSLARVSIPTKITRLYGVFRGCTSLTTVIIPETITRLEIGEDTFRGCPLNVATQLRLRQLESARQSGQQPAPAPAPATVSRPEPPPSFPATHRLTADLNVFAEQHSGSALIVFLRKGAGVQVEAYGNYADMNDITARWARVKTENGQTGWLFSGYLETIR